MLKRPNAVVSPSHHCGSFGNFRWGTDPLKGLQRSAASFHSSPLTERCSQLQERCSQYTAYTVTQCFRQRTACQLTPSLHGVTLWSAVSPGNNRDWDSQVFDSGPGDSLLLYCWFVEVVHPIQTHLKLSLAMCMDIIKHNMSLCAQYRFLSLFILCSKKTEIGNCDTSCQYKTVLFFFSWIIQLPWGVIFWQSFGGWVAWARKRNCSLLGYI